MAIDPEHKARIIEHMDSDHSVEMSQYLRAYNGLSRAAAANAKLADISLDAMTIASASGTHVVPIAPPLGGLKDAGPRLVEMAYAAQAQLGLSDVRVGVYTRPEGLGIASFLGVTQYAVSAAALAAGLLAPGTRAWGLADAHFPGGADAYVWLVKALFVPVVACHVLEAWWMARGRLYRHGVEPGTGLWWLWLANTFIEGYPCMKRFDRVVEAEKQKKH